MNTNWLREFVVLADTCSYAEAAARLFMGQSSLSKHIKALEEELGLGLFERTSRRVRLSPACSSKTSAPRRLRGSSSAGKRTGGSRRQPERS